MTSASAFPPITNPLFAQRRVLTASLVGTSIEFYDFYIYATAAALVFGPLFFPAEDAERIRCDDRKTMADGCVWSVEESLPTTGDPFPPMEDSGTATPAPEVTRPPVEAISTDTLNILQAAVVPENDPYQLACKKAEKCKNKILNFTLKKGEHREDSCKICVEAVFDLRGLFDLGLKKVKRLIF